LLVNRDFHFLSQIWEQNVSIEAPDLCDFARDVYQLVEISFLSNFWIMTNNCVIWLKLNWRKENSILDLFYSSQDWYRVFDIDPDSHHLLKLLRG
jgi:hypothetical protein